jgi:lysophospholipase L1-like esterase
MARLLYACFVLMISAAFVSSQTASQESQECADAKAQVARLQARFQDWGALARYREANAGVTAPAKDEKRVVFMGDSITDLWKLATYFPSKPYINRGISGQTTPQMLIRFRPDVIALKPQVVVILAGTNDIAGNTGPMSLETIEANLTSMFELARANNIRVVIASVLPVSDYGKNREGKPVNQTTRRPPEKIKALNEWIKKYATENGLTYLDYFSATADEKGFLKEELSNDGLHPNDKGYVAMQPLVEQAIAAAMKKRR